LSKTRQVVQGIAGCPRKGWLSVSNKLKFRFSKLSNSKLSKLSKASNSKLRFSKVSNSKFSKVSKLASHPSQGKLPVARQIVQGMAAC